MGLKLEIEMDQGADFNLMIGVYGIDGPVDLTGYEFVAAMRKLTDPDSDPVAEFDFEIQDQAAKTGQVKWFLAAAVVDSIPLSVANPLTDKRLTTPFLFDIKMKDTAGTITRIADGIINVSPQATVEGFS